MNKYIFLVLAVAAIGLNGCTKGCNKTEEPSQPDATQSTNSSSTTTQSNAAAKVEIEDLETGKGAEATNGKTVTVHYTGTLKDGTKFDSSIDRNEPFPFVLGAGQVIKGWEQGILGMKVGGKRKLTIPPELAYGNNAVGAIPANSTLIFEVKLLDVK